MLFQLKMLFVLFLPCQLTAQAASGPDVRNIGGTVITGTKSPAILYAHLDKNIYSVNESVWFTAYLSNDEQQKDMTDFIQAMLIDDRRKVVLTHKFAMKKGIASGNILLPDSLPSGRYKFVIYTNTLLNGKPHNVFTQPLIVKGAAASSNLKTTKNSASSGSINVDDHQQTDPAGVDPGRKPVISIKKAVAEDTLEVAVKNGRLEQFQVLVHNLQEVFFTIPFVVNQQERKLKIALTDLPRGIAELVLLDSANRPCAKRLFFSHYNQQNKLTIETKDSIYKKRQKVEVSLKLADWQGTAIPGTVSVSCIQSNRLSHLLATDIDTYSSWHYPLSSIAVKNALRNQDIGGLEKLLLSSEWKSDSWMKLMAEEKSVIGTLDISGRVTRSGKRLRKPVTLIMMKDSSLSVIPTDSSGKFLLSASDLLQQSHKNSRLMVSGKFPEGYEINVSDPYEKISKSLAAAMDDHEEWDALNPGDIDLGMSAPPRSNQLKEVKIVSRRDMTFYGTRKRENACGDYICKYGYLNCPTHVGDPDNRAPLKGTGYKIYMGLNSGGAEMFSTLIYSGCEVKVYENSKMITGIYQSQEFIPFSFNAASTSLPELSSTLLWVNNCEISPSGTAHFSFYTDDLTGRFKIVVQGLAGDNVVTAEKVITVQ